MGCWHRPLWCLMNLLKKFKGKVDLDIDLNAI